MSDEATPTPAPESESESAPPRRVPGWIPIAAAVAVALGLGGTAGYLLLGPRLRPAPAAHAASASADTVHEAESGDEGKGHGGGHGGDKGHDKTKLFEIENLIVNPAGSMGTRFLMVNVAFELADDKAATRLRAREVQLRDQLMGILETRTLEQLTRPGARDSLRRELATVARPLAGETKWMRVYLPRFVIQ